MKTSTFHRLCDELQVQLADELNQGSRMMKSMDGFTKDFNAQIDLWMNEAISSGNEERQKSCKKLRENNEAIIKINRALKSREKRLEKRAGLLRRLFDDAKAQRKAVITKKKTGGIMTRMITTIGRFLYDAIAALGWVMCEWEPMACKDSAAASSREKRKRQQTDKNI